MSKKILFLVLLGLILMGTAFAAAEPDRPAAYTLHRAVVGSATGDTLHNSAYSMVTTVGEAATGSMSGDGYRTIGGYPHNTIPEPSYQMFLPAVTH
jgi:hypothetical protein